MEEKEKREGEKEVRDMEIGWVHDYFSEVLGEKKGLGGGVEVEREVLLVLGGVVVSVLSVACAVLFSPL